MLRRRNGLQIPGIIALHAFDKGNAEAGREKRILAIRFLAASPTRIAKNVDVGGPKSKTVKTFTLIVCDRVVILSPCFIGNSAGHSVYQFLIPRSSQSNRLRKDSCCSCIRDAMQRFVPPVVSG